MVIFLTGGGFILLQNQQIISQLEKLDFTGKGEAFAESKFLTPLLECLGYETHRDYEVIRHGDDGSAFKLQYPPVEKGAVRVKHYNPDYIPTIRKKAFWVIEAKSPKDVAYPFEGKYLVQGLQYCIHPEIQAKYLLVSNGENSAVYDAHGSVFLEKEIYEPILEFKPLELSNRWSEIYELLSVETLRTRIEGDLKAMYDKLCLSSLDRNYPSQLLRSIGISAGNNSQEIEKHVRRLYLESIDQSKAAWRKEMEKTDLQTIFDRMDSPLGGGDSEAHYFINGSLKNGNPPNEILKLLICDFDQQSIFRKEQTFVAVSLLHQLINDPITKASIRSFSDQYKDSELPLHNQVECAQMRVTRKISVISIYPELRRQISKELQSAPEIVRFVQQPTALNSLYPLEIFHHTEMYKKFLHHSEVELQELLDNLLKIEMAIEQQFNSARSKLPDNERQMSDIAYYGMHGKHYAFKNILHNFGVELNTDIPNGF